MSMDTCAQALGDNWQGIHAIAYYSHLVPVVIALFLGFYALFKTKGSQLAILFAGFTIGVSLWLIGDLVDWVSSNYFLIYYTWSWLDFVNIVFFVFGAYFFSVLARDKISIWGKVAYVLLCIPALVIVVTGTSVLEFTQSICQAVNNDLLTNYKLAVEGLMVISMLASLIIAWRKSDFHKRIQLVTVLAAVLLFFTVFAGTEYFSSITGNYLVNLYSLFVLPIFLIVMVFAVTNLGLFNFRLLGTQILSYVLILMSGLQLLFVQDSTHATLSVITLAISIFFGVLLLQNAQKEEKARLEVERLAKELEASNGQLSEFMSLATHEIRNPATFIKGFTAGALEGDLGELTPILKDGMQKIFVRVNDIIHLGNQYLDKSKLELNKLTYDFTPTDLGKLVEDLKREFEPAAVQRGIAITSTIDKSGQYTVQADSGKIKEVIGNLIDNAIKYTKDGNGGSVTVSVVKGENTVTVKIADNGDGIPAETIPQLFKKFSRADAQKANLLGTGLGLYLAKIFIDAHQGKIWVESPGKDKGSTFYVELPIAQADSAVPQAS